MAKNETIKIDVIATSDMHSQFLNGSHGSNIYRAGTYVKEVRQNNDNVLLLDSGGTLAGSIAAFYYAVVAPYKRHPLIKLMNAMQYDASGISPKEFKFGLSFFSKAVALSRFPWLSANIEYAQTREPYFSTPFTTKIFNGVKVAIIGLTSEGLMDREYFELEPEVRIEKMLTSAKRWILYIYENEAPDFLIAIYHGGLDRLSQSHVDRALNANEAEKLIKSVGVIDLLITGHQRQTYIGNDDKTVYVQAGQNAEQLVHIELSFIKHTTSYELEHVTPQVIDLNEYEEDDMLLKTTHYDRKAVEYWSEECVAAKPVNMYIEGLEDVVTAPHPFTQLLQDIIQTVYTNTISCVHMPKNGEHGLQGMVTNNDIYDACPHPDYPADITIKGQDIKNILEYSYAHLAFNEGRLSLTIVDETLCTFWQGFEYHIDMSAPPYQRVTLEGIQLDHNYRVTMTDYCYRSFKHMLHDAYIHHISDTTLGELIADQLRQSDYTPQLKNNFSVHH